MGNHQVHAVQQGRNAGLIEVFALHHLVGDTGERLHLLGDGLARVFEFVENHDLPDRQARGRVHIHPQHGQFNDLVAPVIQPRRLGVKNQDPHDGALRCALVMEDRCKTPQHAVIGVLLQPGRHGGVVQRGHLRRQTRVEGPGPRFGFGFQLGLDRQGHVKAVKAQLDLHIGHISLSKSWMAGWGLHPNSPILAGRRHGADLF